MTVEGAQPYTRAERLLNLMMALRVTEVGLNRDQIRSVVRGYDRQASTEAFERMFERDKDDLRAMGVPVVTLFDSSGVVLGYRIDGDWALPALDLDRVGMAVLGIAARAWRSADLAPAALTALRKVEARVGASADPLAGAPVTGLRAETPALAALIEACRDRCPVAFHYRKPGAEPQERHVQPWGLVWWRAHWYLVGHDTDRGALRVFRASRIEGEVRRRAGEGTYDIPSGVDVRGLVGRFAADDRVEVELALAPGACAELRRRGRPAGALSGRDLVSLPAERVATAVASALGYGGAAQVMGPPEAVAVAVAQLEAIVSGQESPPAVAAGRAQRGHRPARAAGQFPRLLALVPWLAANSGVSVSEAADHFGITPEQLLGDLGSVITSGSDDWTLFDIQYWDDDGIITVIDALELAEPLQLTPDEGFALLVALEALAVIPGSHDRGVIERVAATLRAALGAKAPAPGTLGVRVDLPEATVGLVTEAQRAGRAMELAYLGAVRDEVTQRTVDPVDVVVVDGYGYLRARCRAADALRMFRLDRIIDLRVSGLPADPSVAGTGAPEPMAITLSETGRLVLLDVAPDSLVLDDLPVVRRWSLADGWVRLEVPVGEYEWARRLVLSSAGRVVLREPAWLAEQVVSAARASLEAHWEPVA